MDDITKRFLDYYEVLKKEAKVKNATEFAKSIGISSSLMTELKEGRTKIGIKPIQNTVLEYNISAEWLLIGKEPMLKEQSESPQQSTAIDNSTINIYIDRITEQAEQIGEFKNEIKNLEKTVTALQVELECCKKENTELRTITHSKYNAEQKLYELPEIPAMLAAEPRTKYNKNAQKSAQK
ncbi:MAG: hypothetical protein LBK94_00530 [Prevotellaceae bacterium]|nr:hypothetical protein [Prevotellaceae bacterium]